MPEPHQRERSRSAFEHIERGNEIGGVSYTIGAESGNVIRLTAQLQNGLGKTESGVRSFLGYLSTQAGGGNLAGTAPTSGVATGGAGAIVSEVVADKAFWLLTDTGATVSIDINDTGSNTFYFSTVLSNGRLSVSSAITFST